MCKVAPLVVPTIASAVMKGKNKDLQVLPWYLKERTHENKNCLFKVLDMSNAVIFWSSLLGIQPHKSSSNWNEFMIQGLRLGFLLNDYGDKFTGSNCVPVFEFSEQELPLYIEKAKSLGARVIVNGLEDPNLLSVVFADPFGNEFELSKFHD